MYACIIAHAAEGSSHAQRSGKGQRQHIKRLFACSLQRLLAHRLQLRLHIFRHLLALGFLAYGRAYFLHKLKNILHIIRRMAHIDLESGTAQSLNGLHGIIRNDNKIGLHGQHAFQIASLRSALDGFDLVTGTADTGIVCQQRQGCQALTVNHIQQNFIGRYVQAHNALRLFAEAQLSAGCIRYRVQNLTAVGGIFFLRSAAGKQQTQQQAN